MKPVLSDRNIMGNQRVLAALSEDKARNLQLPARSRRKRRPILNSNADAMQSMVSR